MKISAITVCWNAEKTIRHTLESFLSQDYPNREMIVVDGLSKDSTLEIVRSYNSPLITIHSGKDNGIYDAMNKGLTLYTGDAVGLLNADDVYHAKNTLSLIAAALKTKPVVTGHCNMVPDHTSGVVATRWKIPPFTPGAFLKGWVPPHPATYAVREVYDKVGGFDTSYRICADYDWMVRVFEVHKYDHLVLDEVLADMMLGGLSTSGVKAMWTNLRETSRSRQKWLGTGPVDQAMMIKVFGKLKSMARIKG